jgi:hypothetical protein
VRSYGGIPGTLLSDLVFLITYSNYYLYNLTTSVSTEVFSERATDEGFALHSATSYFPNPSSPNLSGTGKSQRTRLPHMPLRAAGLDQFNPLLLCMFAEVAVTTKIYQNRKWFPRIDECPPGEVMEAGKCRPEELDTESWPSKTCPEDQVLDENNVCKEKVPGKEKVTQSRNIF